MKVVLDTNVIIAAFAARGLCADLLEVCLADHQIISSGYILDEVNHNLVSKLRLAESKAAEIRSFLASVATVITPAVVSLEACRDPDDLPVIGTALAAGASVLISGDKDLLVLERVADVKIVTPRQFWEMLHSEFNRDKGVQGG